MIKYAMMTIMVALTGCSTLDPYTGASEEAWNQADMQTKLMSGFTFMSQTGQSYVDARTDAADELLVVRLKKATAKMWPSGNRYAINPVMFALSPNSCQTVRLTATKDVAQHSDLKACYRNAELQIDPSRWNFHFAGGSLVMKSSPMWSGDGMEYTDLASSGYTGLADLTVDVQLSSANA
jgi:hypothetical protein